jgi:class 3 adenylate cyclase
MTDPRFGLDHAHIFSDPALEDEYEAQNVRYLQRSILVSLAINMMGVILQKSVLFYSEERKDWRIQISQAATWGFRDFERFMHICAAAQVAASVGIAVAVCLNGHIPRVTRWCSFGLLCLRTSFVVCSMVASRWSQNDSWLLIFPATWAINSFWFTGGQSYRSFTLAYPCTVAICLYSMHLKTSLGLLLLNGSLLRLLVSVFAIYAMSSRSDSRRRALFHLSHVVTFEEARIRATLLDLLPHDFVQKNLRLLMDAGYETGAGTNLGDDVSLWRLRRFCPCRVRFAVVMQFDVVDFTQLCRKLGHMAVAQLMHELFSAFDESVKSLRSRLFKMDTVGDAYVAAGWLFPDEDEDEAEGSGEEEAGSARDTCHQVLWLGGMMLMHTRELRKRSGHELHCRIGVGTGRILAGSMGWLQPRFHLRGPAMQIAEKNESTAVKGSIHVSSCFLDALSAPGGGRGGGGGSGEEESCGGGAGAGAPGRDEGASRFPAGWRVVKTLSHFGGRARTGGGVFEGRASGAVADGREGEIERVAAGLPVCGFSGCRCGSWGGSGGAGRGGGEAKNRGLCTSYCVAPELGDALPQCTASSS